MTADAASTHFESLAPASGVVRQLVVLLHGYGSNGADLIGLAPQWRRAIADTLFLAPNAPERCGGAPGGYQWWGLSAFDRASLAAGARRAASPIDAFLDDRLAEHGLDESSLVLVGFSQGTMMALHVGLRRARAVAGILGYSGMLAETDGLAREVRSRPPVLLIHGDADPIVPVGALHNAETTLRAIGIDVEAQVTRGLGHSVDLAGLQRGQAFVQRVLSG